MQRLNLMKLLQCDSEKKKGCESETIHGRKKKIILKLVEDYRKEHREEKLLCFPKKGNIIFF